MLKHLEDKLQATEVVVHANVKSNFFTGLDGIQCQQVRNEAVGETRGLSQLKRYLQELELGYKETLELQQNQNNN